MDAPWGFHTLTDNTLRYLYPTDGYVVFTYKHHVVGAQNFAPLLKSNNLIYIR